PDDINWNPNSCDLNPGSGIMHPLSVLIVN
uniref:Uncharacterized protein n=1 Tax=Aegilops tauschii subsp. strangulata TaxID=200361 RepID=A0A453KFS9_AEGTS